MDALSDNLANLKDSQFDIIIVGGGVYGAVIARESALCGYRTALVEKDEFCGSTSAHSLNVLHGGLRYLQHFNISRMRRSIYSRRYFQQISPDNIEYLPFLTPLDRWGINSPFIMRSALLINDLISIDRNKGISKQQYIKGGCVLSRKSLLRELPEFSDKPVSGAAIWYEAVMNNVKQLVNDILDSAKNNGAVIANNTEAIELLHHEGKLTGLSCRNRQGNEIRINGKIVIDTSGRTSVKLGSSLPDYQAIRQHWARAVNMLIDRRLFKDYSVGLKYSDNVTDKEAKFNSGNRYLFFVPIKDGNAIGTFYESENAVAGKLEINLSDQQKYLDAVNSVLPEGSISSDNITGWQSGWLPVDNDDDQQLNIAKASRIRSIHSNGEFSGLIEVRSVKFTTAPAVARDVIEVLRSNFG